MSARPRSLLVVLVLAAVLVPSRVSVPLAALVVLVAGGSRWWMRRAARGIEVECAMPEWADHGQHIEAVLEMRNTSRLPVPWAELDLPTALGLGRSEPYREALVLRPRSSVRRRVPLRCLQRGRHNVGPPRVRLGDVLGVAEQRADLLDPLAVTVFPRIVPLERLGLPAQSPFVTVPSQRSLLVDPSAVVGVREYRPGDPLSAIHWTATARTRELVVKQYERAEARDTLVCLDLMSESYPRSARQPSVELAVTVAASVLHHSISKQRLPAGLLMASWTPAEAQPLVSLPPRADHAHLRSMLEYLALAEHGAHTPLAEMLATLNDLPSGTTVLAITGKLEESVAGHLLRLAREGVPVAVALTGPSAVDDALTVGDLWLPIYRVTDLPAVQGLAA